MEQSLPRIPERFFYPKIFDLDAVALNLRTTAVILKTLLCSFKTLIHNMVILNIFVLLRLLYHTIVKE